MNSKNIGEALDEIDLAVQKIVQKYGFFCGDNPSANFGHLGLKNISIYVVSATEMQKQWLIEMDEIKRLGAGLNDQIFIVVDDIEYEVIGYDPDFGDKPIKLKKSGGGCVLYAEANVLQIGVLRLV